MDAKQLMIGDRVFIEEGDALAPTQMVCIMEDNTEWLHPIPLTPEILEKNGFVKVNSQRYRWGELCGNILFHVDANPKKGYFYITNESHQNHANVYDSFYVHTFQNALRLCGLTDLADNFKV